LSKALTARHSLASHQAAKPSTSARQTLTSGGEAEHLSAPDAHIRRRSRAPQRARRSHQAAKPSTSARQTLTSGGEAEHLSAPDAHIRRRRRAPQRAKTLTSGGEAEHLRRRCRFVTLMTLWTRTNAAVDI